MKILKESNSYILVESEKTIGRVSFLRGGNSNLVISYFIDPKHRGKGLALEMLKKVLELEKSRPIFAYTYEDNYTSIRILEASGFKEFEKQSFILK